jgi:hypothetical protein
MWVMVGTTITILGMGLGALVLLKKGEIDASLGSVLVILTFVAFVIVTGVLLWRLLHLHKLSKEQRTLQSTQDSDHAELNEVRTRALSDPGEPVPTVTEQTTRNLEHSYRESKQQ